MRRIFSFNMPTLLLPLVIQILGSLLLWLTASQALAVAPITPSGGLNTQVNLAPTPSPGKVQYDITGGTRAGTNLFHSFGDFNVPNNNIANFLNTQVNGVFPATSNILGRVTNGNISNIFGTIQTTNFGPANLFLMNPAGFLFGPNATLNVGGMVAFTSADYLRLADGAMFNAIPNPAADALLSAAPVAAFGFLGSNPGAITVQGSQFTVTEGTGISLVGGKITIQNGTLENGTVQPARLSAPNGQINLATAASSGEFLLQGLNTSGIQEPLAGPNVNDGSFTSYGAVHFAPGSTVDVSQTGNGKVSIRGGQLVLEVQNAFLSTANSAAPPVTTPGQDTVIFSGGSSIASVTTSSDPGPDVQIVADRIQFLGTPPSFEPEFTPPNPVNILTTALGTGKAGNITVTANQNMDLSTATIASFSPLETGNSGNINLTSTNGNISMTNGVFVTSQAIGAAGEAGTITVSAPHGDIDMQVALLLSEIGFPGGSAGGGGGIQVTANNLTMGGLFSGIQIDNFNTPVPAPITVNLSGRLSLDGNVQIQTIARGSALAAADLNITAHDVSLSGGSVLNTETRSSGPGGQLNISTNTLQLTTGGQILSGSNLGLDPVTGEPVIPSGAGGTINIQGLAGPAASVLIDGAGSGIFTNAVGTGAAGNILVNANSVALHNGAQVTSSSTGTGIAGDITINAGNQFAMTNSSVTTEANQASGGSIKITTNPTGTVQLTDSLISASVLDGAGGGGSVNIDPQFVLLQNSQILANAVFGPGGNISITTNLLLPDSTSIISASSQFGQQGTITIQQPIAPASRIIQLSQKPLLATTLLSQRCAALAGGNFSSFTVAGRDSLPTEPSGWLASPLAALSTGTGHQKIGERSVAMGEWEGRLSGLSSLSGSVRTGIPSHEIDQIDQIDEPPLLSLRQIAPPGFLTQAFAVDWSAGCTS